MRLEEAVARTDLTKNIYRYLVRCILGKGNLQDRKNRTIFKVAGIVAQSACYFIMSVRLIASIIAAPA